MSHVDLLSFQILICLVGEISTDALWDEANRTVSSAAKWHQSSWNLSVMFTAQCGCSGIWIMGKE